MGTTREHSQAGVCCVPGVRVHVRAHSRPLTSAAPAPPKNAMRSVGKPHQPMICSCSYIWQHRSSSSSSSSNNRSGGGGVREAADGRGLPKVIPLPILPIGGVGTASVYRTVADGRSQIRCLDGNSTNCSCCGIGWRLRLAMRCECGSMSAGGERMCMRVRVSCEWSGYGSPRSSRTCIGWSGSVQCPMGWVAENLHSFAGTHQQTQLNHWHILSASLSHCIRFVRSPIFLASFLFFSSCSPLFLFPQSPLLFWAPLGS